MMSYNRYSHIRYLQKQKLPRNRKRFARFILIQLILCDGVLCPLDAGVAKPLYFKNTGLTNRLCSKAVKNLQGRIFSLCLGTRRGMPFGVSSRRRARRSPGFQAINLIKAVKRMFSAHPENQILKVFLVFDRMASLRF